MAEGKINGNLKINDGSTDYRTLKELNNLVTTLNTNLTKILPVCLYDSTGIDGPTLNKANGIRGTESVSINMTEYKCIEVYGYGNTRKYQWNLKIRLDIPVMLNTFNLPSKYWGNSVFIDTIYDQENIFEVSCSVTENKQTFCCESFLTRPFNDMNSRDTRNTHDNYRVDKIYGYKY